MPITLQTGDLYFSKYCTDFTGGVCLQWTTVIAQETFPLIEVGTSVLYYAGIFLFSIIILFYILKFLFFKVTGIGRKRRY